MLRGHVTGTKRERKNASAWYRAIEKAHLRRIETQGDAAMTTTTPRTRQTTKPQQSQSKPLAETTTDALTTHDLRMDSLNQPLKPSSATAVCNQMVPVNAELAGREVTASTVGQEAEDVSVPGYDAQAEPEPQATDLAVTVQVAALVAEAAQAAPEGPAAPEGRGASHGHAYGQGSAPDGPTRASPI